VPKEGLVVRTSMIRTPTTTIAFADRSDMSNTYIVANPDPISGWGVSDRHLGRVAVAFVGGNSLLVPEESISPDHDNWFNWAD
jgi:hypothetical protein